MRALFLDIDGVLLPIGACTAVEIETILDAPDEHLQTLISRVPREAVEAVLHLCTAGGGQIVIISTWRRLFPKPFVESFLAGLGLGPHLHADWWCSRRGFGSSKKDDIFLWIADHPAMVAAVTIDDWEIGLPYPMIQIQPDPKVGLTKADLTKARHRRRLQNVMLAAGDA